VKKKNSHYLAEELVWKKEREKRGKWKKESLKGKLKKDRKKIWKIKERGRGKGADKWKVRG
jgi:hypothetical protein